MLNFDCFRSPSISKFQFRSVITFLFLFGLLIQTGRPAGWPIWLTGARRCPHAMQWEFPVRFRWVSLRRNKTPRRAKAYRGIIGAGAGHWAWHCHSLCPRAYQTDCLAAVKRPIGRPVFSCADERIMARQLVCAGWVVGWLVARTDSSSSSPSLFTVLSLSL